MYDAAAEQRLIATSKYGSRLTVLAVGAKSSISIGTTT